MLASEQVEKALGINLPRWYSYLINNPPELEEGSMLELYLQTDPEWLIENNRGYVSNINDITDLDDGTLIGNMKRFLLYGSKSRIIRHRKKYYDNWVEKNALS